jgi:hypothetical protein
MATRQLLLVPATGTTTGSTTADNTGPAHDEVWRLDERTRAVGLAGLARAREALRARPAPHLPDHGRTAA